VSSVARSRALAASAAIPMSPKTRLGLEVKGNGSNVFTPACGASGFYQNSSQGPKAVLTAE